MVTYTPMIKSVDGDDDGARMHKLKEEKIGYLSCGITHEHNAYLVFGQVLSIYRQRAPLDARHVRSSNGARRLLVAVHQSLPRGG